MPDEVTPPVQAEPTPAPAAAPIVKGPSTNPVFAEYELGDTSYEPSVDSALPDQTPARPRNADGTFAAPAPPAPPPSAPTRFTHPARMVRMATELGMGDDEISSSSPDVLADLVYHLHKQQQVGQREAVRQELLPGTGQPQSVQFPGQAAAQAQPGAALVQPPDDYDLGIDVSPYDPPLVDAIKKIGKQAADAQKQIAALQNELAQREFRRAAETNNQVIDRVFAGHEDRFGKGSRAEIKTDTAEYRRRMAALSIVNLDESKDALETKLNRAIAEMYGQSAPAADPLAARRLEWQNGAVARPTHRDGGAEPPGEKKAIATAARIMREQGTLDEDTSMDGFL